MNDTIDDRVWGMMERVTKLETLLESHSRESAHFRETTNARFEELAAGQRAMNSKLDVITNRFNTAETQVKTGFSLVGWVVDKLPPIGIGGVVTWLATHFWPGK